jgi:hypothetical protein
MPWDDLKLTSRDIAAPRARGHPQAPVREAYLVGPAEAPQEEL